MSLRSSPPLTSARLRALSVRLSCTALLAGAISACGVGPAPQPILVASEGDWQRLVQPRPVPLEGAVRIAVGPVSLMETAGAWASTDRVSAELGVAEMVGAGLLRRRDVHYVERRRFSAAVERERRGDPAPAGAPEIGTSPGAEYLLGMEWVAVNGRGRLSLRLVDPATSDVAAAWNVDTPADPESAGLARLAVASLAEQLARMDRRPLWTDPRSTASTAGYRPSDVEIDAQRAFLDGVAAEDRYDWEAARRGYQTALSAADDFFEATVALARVARIRAGGTLGSH